MNFQVDYIIFSEKKWKLGCVESFFLKFNSSQSFNTADLVIMLRCAFNTHLQEKKKIHVSTIISKVC